MSSWWVTGSKIYCMGCISMHIGTPHIPWFQVHKNTVDVGTHLEYSHLWHYWWAVVYINILIIDLQQDAEI